MSYSQLVNLIVSSHGVHTHLHITVSWLAIKHSLRLTL